MRISKEDVLDALGIERGPEWLPIALAGFGLGCLVGASAAILLSPKSGREIRQGLAERSRDLFARGKEYAGKAEEVISKSPNTPGY